MKRALPPTLPSMVCSLGGNYESVTNTKQSPFLFIPSLLMNLLVTSALPPVVSSPLLLGAGAASLSMCCITDQFLTLGGISCLCEFGCGKLGRLPLGASQEADSEKL